MLYILPNPKKQAPWQIDYEGLYLGALNELNYPALTIEPNQLNELTEKDILWIMHYSDIDTPEVRFCKAKKMAQVNGTAVNPYIQAVNPNQECYEYNDILDIGLCFDEVMVKEMSQRFPSVKFLATGFPMSTTAEKFSSTSKKKQIAIAGRLDVYKNVGLNLYLTEPLRKYQGYKVIFCYPDNPRQEDLQRLYTLSRFENVEARRCSKRNWLKIAGESEFYLITSLDDTLSVSLWEATMAGCYPLVADVETGIIRYPAYVSKTFKTFDRDDLLSLVEEKPHQTMDVSMIDPTECAKKLIEQLKEYDEDSIRP